MNPVLDIDSPAPATAAPLPASLRQRAMTGSAWWTAAFIGMKGLQLVSNIILAWLLSPAVFGIVALSDVVMRGLNCVTDVGLRPALVQNERDDQAFLDTAWTVQIVRGILVFLASCVLAWPVATLYDTPLLLWILPVTGAGALLGSFQSTQYYRLNRRLDEKPRAILRLNQNLITRAGMIGIAVVSPTPWALVIGGIAGTAYFVARSHGMVKGPWHRFRAEPKALRSIVHFGRWVLLGSLIVFAAREADKLLLGGIVNEEMATLGLLGVYVLAQRLASTPAEGIQALAGQVALPLLAETARLAPDQFTLRLLRIRRIIMWPAMTASLGVIWFSPIFFQWFYDERYADAIWMTPLISITIWITLLNGMVNRALLALAQVRTLAWTGAVNAVGTIGGALVGYQIAHMPGFIIGVTTGSLAQHVCELVMLRRRQVSVWHQDVFYSAIFIALAAVGAAPRWISVASIDSATIQLLALAIPMALFVPLGFYATHLLWREVRRK